VQVIVASNPRSGLGRAAIAARQFSVELASCGISTWPIELGAADDDERIAAATRCGPSILVAAGGDGTVRSLLQNARETGAVLFHLATGNENLFARHFNWPLAPRAAARLIASTLGLIAQADGVAHSRSIAAISLDGTTADGLQISELAAIMLSIGPDAEVVSVLDRTPRTLPGHLAYILPVLATLPRLRMPALTIVADGRAIAREQPGWLLLSNMNEFALRIDPLPGATELDGYIDGLFVPLRGGTKPGDGVASIADSIGLIAELLRQHAQSLPGARRFRARELVVSGRGFFAQADGDLIPTTRPSQTARRNPLAKPATGDAAYCCDQLRIRCVPNCVRVLHATAASLLHN